ncbi:SDR family NAD(P)-dependent oxidoreductase [Algoriphagus hitonicola]|uniref:NAD(P)-dependent dehydrogenase, short-chain alcohol dehydrogenase family n=1 Tax=Algoriphagus hitonicola TaxID=435880 RepID=A0A1I2Q1S6_9BACT|nr:SDR family oxidoreductase [Algoriphagus hitonicola]SFG21633.1 NAD(P)-dependent dehydrogenase, short-chain alcohol dehydrogenase family [Algoriphagus hitonicola]
MKLQNKTFIVTGATSGMGKAIALTFAREGANLVLSGRNEEAGKGLTDRLGNNAYFLPGDVSNPDYNQALVDLALEKFGQLDGLSTNAGMLGLGSITELPLEKWSQTLEVNLSSVFYLLKAALPDLQKSPQAVVVINSSIAAFKTFPNHPAYCASKAGLVALAKQAAVDYGPTVRINCICPGPVDTPFIHASAAAFPDPAKAVENAGKNTLIQRLGEPEDIAKLAFFLASDDASWITGAAYTIDGGIMAQG